MIHHRALLLLSLLTTLIPCTVSAQALLRARDIEAESPPTTAQPDPAGDDIILLNNGDLMHGSFAGMDDGLLWKRSDIERPIKFAIPSVKQILFQATRRLELAPQTSFITLSSGDHIPGEIISLDGETLSLKSPIIGDITLPRNLIRKIAPNPFGGDIHYLGPYSSDGWLTLETIEDEPIQEEVSDDPKQEEANSDPQELTDAKKDKAPSWFHSGTSFYSQSTQPLILTGTELPETGRISFHIAWKGRLSMVLALHSDLTRVLTPAPKIKDNDDGDDEAVENDDVPVPALARESALNLQKGEGLQSIPWIKPEKKTNADIFGTSYVLSLQSGYPTLTRNFFNEEGISRQERLNTNRSSASLNELDEAHVEIRFNRKKSLFILYLNGIYSNQWSDVAGALGQGSFLGFMNRSPTSQVRISELVISSWKGSSDSARSMDHPQRDVALLTNGTDRFSGKLSEISEGRAHFQTDYSDIQIPLKELALINLNPSQLIDIDSAENSARFALADDSLTVIYQPFGLIQVQPLSATAHTLSGRSPFLGPVTLDLTPALLLRFNADSLDLSTWFDDF